MNRKLANRIQRYENGYHRPDPLERDIKAQIIELLEVAGWGVFDMSQRKRVEGGLVSFPDLIAFKHNVTLLIECKTARGQLREGQKMFREVIAGHEGTHLRYVLARDVDDVAREINKAAVAILTSNSDVLSISPELVRDLRRIAQL